MATQTLIQYLETSAVTGLGVSVPVGAGTMNRSQTETFVAGGAISQGDWLALDTSQTGANKALFVVEAAGVAIVGQANVIGVALADAAAGEKVPVCVAGYCPKASVAGAAVAGSALVGPIGVAGQAAIEVPGTTSGKLCGVALAADVANFAEVLVIKTF